MLNSRPTSLAQIILLTFIASTPYLSFGTSRCAGQETQLAKQLAIPDNADVSTLNQIVAKAKEIPKNPSEYRIRQTAIRDASKKLTELLEGQNDSTAYRQAEVDLISASVSLMAFFGEDAKNQTLKSAHAFLKSRKQLSIQDVQTGMLTATMLELQPNKKPAIETYQLLDKLLTGDKREEMRQLRVNLQAAIHRLELLGKKLEFAATDLNGKKLTTANFAGNYLIVEFFASWSPSCQTEMQHLKSRYEKYHSRGLNVVGISIDSDAKKLREFVSKNEIPWSVVHDNNPDPLKRLQMKCGVSVLPLVMLLNKEGTVVSLEAHGAELDRLMQLLFDAPTPAPAPTIAPASNGSAPVAAPSNP